MTLEFSGQIFAHGTVEARLALALVLGVLLAKPSLHSGKTDALVARSVHRLLAGPAVKARDAEARSKAVLAVQHLHRNVLVLTEIAGEPRRTFALELRSLRVDLAAAAVLARVAEARVVDVARDAAVTLGAYAHVPAFDLRRAAHAVVLARRGRTGGLHSLAVESRVAVEARALELTLADVVARAAVQTRPAHAHVLPVFAHGAAESAKTDAHVPTVGRFVTGASVLAVISLARALLASENQKRLQNGTGSRLLAVIALVRCPAHADEAQLVVRHLAVAAVLARRRLEADVDASFASVSAVTRSADAVVILGRRRHDGGLVFVMDKASASVETVIVRTAADKS